MKKKQLFRYLAVCFAILAFTETAMACSVCAIGSEESRPAYYLTTVMMSLLPLGMIGGVAYYVAKKNR